MESDAVIVDDDAVERTSPAFFLLLAFDLGNKAMLRIATVLPAIDGHKVVAPFDVEGFDATVTAAAQNTRLEYGCSNMEESVLAWSDCQNRFAWVPDYAKAGILFRGPHLTPGGTEVRISASGAFRAYVIVEADYDGGVARSGGLVNSLPSKGWQLEPAPPSWGDKKSRMKVFSYMAPEGVQLQLPATSGQAVFSIVVVGISASSDKQMAEELKRVFRLWDPSREVASREKIWKHFSPYCVLVSMPRARRL